MKADMTEVRKALEELKKVSADIGMEPGEFADLERTIEKIDKKTRKQEILDTVETAVARFFYYDRKDDEDLPPGAIQEAVAAGELSEEELVEAFAEQIRAVMREAGV